MPYRSNTAEFAAFKKRQRVMVSYGCVQIMQAVGQFGVFGEVVSTKHARRGWYGVQLSGSTLEPPRLVTVRADALTAL